MGPEVLNMWYSYKEIFDNLEKSQKFNWTYFSNVYRKWTQKNKIMSIILKNPHKWYMAKDFQQWRNFVWYEAWSRLSEMLKDWILEAETINEKKRWQKFKRYKLQWVEIRKSLLTKLLLW